MSASAQPQFTFTKLVVADLEKCAAFYRAAFALRDAARIESEIAGRPIEEILFTTNDGGPTFVLLHYVDRDVPSAGETILGFLTADIDALVGAVVAAGGSVVSDADARPDLGVKVAFVADVEGHLIELVQRTS
jgi:predicted enzyme related to lactoylglutathione lyase